MYGMFLAFKSRHEVHTLIREGEFSDARVKKALQRHYEDLLRLDIVDANYLPSASPDAARAHAVCSQNPHATTTTADAASPARASRFPGINLCWELGPACGGGVRGV